MPKRKHSLVDLTKSPQLIIPPPVEFPLPAPLTSRTLTPRSDSPLSSISSLSSRSRSKRTRKIKVDTPQPDVGTSQQAIDVDAVNVDAGPSAPIAGPSNPRPPQRTPSPPPSHLLAAHTCPICFSGVTNACLTPCGHVLCGACLFAAVKSGIQRALAMGMLAGSEGAAAKCPVCRAVLKGWDGKGGGVIPLKIRTIVAL